MSKALTELYMEPITITLLTALGVFGTGIIDKAAESAWNEVSQRLQEKLKGTKTQLALTAGESPDFAQAVIDVEGIQCDSEVQALAEKINQLIAQNEDLQRQFNEAIRQQPQIIKNWQGINAETGSNVTIHNPTLHF